MPDLEPPSPLRVFKIRVFESSEQDRDALLDKILEVIRQKHKSVSQTPKALNVLMDKTLCQLSIERINDFLILTSAVDFDRNRDPAKLVDSELEALDLYNLASPFLRSDSLSTFTVIVSIGKDGQLIELPVEQYSHLLSKPTRGIGLVRGFLVSVLDSGTEEEAPHDKCYFLSPLHPERGAAEKQLGNVLEDMKRLAVDNAELSKLYGGCKTFFSAFRPGEAEISSRIEDFQWKLIGPEPVGMDKLEAWLSYIMERENTLSSMISTMKVNTLQAKSIVSNLQNIFNRLGEDRFEDYPTNFEMEMASYLKIASHFEDYVARSEALKARLETVTNQIRTYLSLQQQKIAIEEQKASKEHLVRLVNLQEIFHKVEIFIVAVYITEMARTVFEATVHENAGLATALFIPLALLLAMGVSRILHRESSHH